MTGGCPTACAITSREGEAGYPVAVVRLPALRAAACGGRPQGRP